MITEEKVVDLENQGVSLINENQGVRPKEAEVSLENQGVSQFNEEIASNRNTSEGAADSILVAHVVSCNDGATSDGVELGGKRVEEEIKSVLCRFCTDAHKKGSPPDFITISFIGNSLGGLYARYALVNLAHFVDKGFSDNDKMKLPKIYFNVFCTTATPHLGVSRNTYFPIPRVAEQLIGNIMRSTGRDLFRSNSLLSDMALNSKYISPLTLFRKRIAYANSFGTDFQVPTSTAAFLCKQSNYPHTLKEENYDDNGVFFATFCTKANSDYVQVGEYDELCQMSKSLDNLGWTKVFVDTRDILPFGSFRFPFGSDGRASFCNYASSVSGGNRSESSTKIESKKLLSIFSSMNKVHFPLGHTVLVANSKSKFFSYLNRNGRFVVNALAESVVKDILNFKIIQ